MDSHKAKQRRFDILVNGALALFVFIWMVPVIGLLVSSFRSRQEIQTSPWWNLFPHREYQAVERIRPVDPDIEDDSVIKILGLTTSYGEIKDGFVMDDGINLRVDPTIDLREDFVIFGLTTNYDEASPGIDTPDGRYIRIIGNKRNGFIEVQEKVWAWGMTTTLENYKQVLGGKNFEYLHPDGTLEIIPGDNFWGALANSITVSVPATVIPILIAAFAAYGFAWMKFPGRKILFVVVVALLVVPLQIALVPILGDYKKLGLNGTYLAIWLAHTGFGLPLATYLLFNYISGLPRETLESAFIDGASHFTVFVRLILPLSVPALASFAIFQFLWVWNDYLVALIFLGSDVEVVTMRLAGIVGDRGQDWHLLTAGAFITMVVPLAVFFSLQRFFVRGLLAGSVKG